MLRCGSDGKRNGVHDMGGLLHRVLVLMSDFTAHVRGSHAPGDADGVGLGRQQLAHGVQDVEAPAGQAVSQAILRQGTDSMWRLAGDRYVFVEFGDMVLDFVTRARVAELERWLREHAPDGFVESNPGVRSALLEYDPLVLPLDEMLKLLER